MHFKSLKRLTFAFVRREYEKGKKKIAQPMGYEPKMRGAAHRQTEQTGNWKKWKTG